MIEQSEVEKAVGVLIEEWNADPGFRQAWLANIAMAFKDQANWDKRDWDRMQLHETATKAADYFLRLSSRDLK